MTIDREVAINITLPEDLHRAAKVSAARRGITLKEWILRAVKHELES